MYPSEFLCVLATLRRSTKYARHCESSLQPARSELRLLTYCLMRIVQCMCRRCNRSCKVTSLTGSFSRAPPSSSAASNSAPSPTPSLALHQRNASLSMHMSPLEHSHHDLPTSLRAWGPSASGFTSTDFQTRHAQASTKRHTVQYIPNSNSNCFCPTRACPDIPFNLPPRSVRARTRLSPNKIFLWSFSNTHRRTIIAPHLIQIYIIPPPASSLVLPSAFLPALCY